MVVFITAIFSVFLQSCSEDDPITPQSPHFSADGLMILDESFSDTVLYLFQGVFKPGFDTLKVPYGTISPHWQVFFLNSSGVRVDPPSGSENNSDYVIGNSAIAQVYLDDPVNEKWAFHLRGITVGNTTLVIKILHVDHADFTTPPIPVTVDPNIIGEAVGMKISFEKDNELIYRDSSGIITGPGFMVNAGDTTEHAVVQFYDKSGSLFTPPYPAYNLNGVFQNAGICGFINEAPDEPFVIRINGISAGNTTLIIDLLEGSKAIYNSSSIPVNISP